MKKGEIVPINFPGNNLHYLGRNGSGKCEGMEVFRTSDGKSIDLFPINSLGDTARCRIELPQDPVALRQLAMLLSQAAESIDTQNDKPRIGRVELQLGYAVDLDDLSKVDEAKEKIIDDLTDLVFKGGEEAIRTFIVEKHDSSLTEEDVCEELVSEYEGDEVIANIGALGEEQPRGCS
jgi:hypothetical protein